MFKLIHERQIFYWLNINNDIENCKICQKFQYNNLKEPLDSHPLPSISIAKNFF